MTDIQIEIDGKKITTQPGKMIIQVADDNGISIPRFCYHKKLSIAANCRMCLVEVEKAPKTLPACATPVNDGMKVFTQSAKTLESQRAVMEFLLINHPLDCPICDQGGQCELQDFSLEYGKDNSAYREEKRAVANDNFGPLIATEMTRCIHCTRCVRFGQEILGVQEIGAMGRGENTQISTYVKHTIDHEMSGNIIDLCPVGALLAKPFLYRARAWELTSMASIAPHDGLGSNISVHVRRGEVMRIVPRDNEDINENWLSDRDRFSYQGLSVDRLEKPLLKDKVSGEWREVSWQVALNYIADGLEKIKAAHGGDSIRALLSPNSTLEEVYLLKKLWDHLGSAQIEYRLRRSAPGSLALSPGLGLSFEEVENQKVIVLVGAHVRNDQPLLAHRIRKAALKGAKVHVIDSVRHPYAFDLASQTIVKPSEIKIVLQGLVSKVSQEGVSLDSTLLAIHRSDVLRNVTDTSLPTDSSSSLIIMGDYAFNHPDAEIIHAQLSDLATKTNSTLAVLCEGANAVGCHSLDAWTPSEKKVIGAGKAYLLHGIEPDFDVADSQQCRQDFLSAELVISVSPFVSDHLKQMASVLLPSAAFTETAGTFINLAGEQQSFMGCVPPKGDARPAWKIFRVLGNLLHVPGFEFESSEEILKASKIKMSRKTDVHNVTKDVCRNVTENHSFFAQNEGNSLEIITFWPNCRSDALVRRAKALNDRALHHRWETVHLHPKTAEKLGIVDDQTVTLKQNQQQVMCKVTLDGEVVPGAILIARGTELAIELLDALRFVALIS